MKGDAMKGDAMKGTRTMRIWADAEHVARVRQCNDEIERAHGMQVTLCGALSAIEGNALALAERLGRRQAYEVVTHVADRLAFGMAAEMVEPAALRRATACRGRPGAAGRFSKYLPKALGGRPTGPASGRPEDRR